MSNIPRPNGTIRVEIPPMSGMRCLIQVIQVSGPPLLSSPVLAHGHFNSQRGSVFNLEVICTHMISRELGRLLIIARVRILPREYGPSSDLEGEGSQPNNREYCVSPLPRA